MNNALLTNLNLNGTVTDDYIRQTEFMVWTLLLLSQNFV